MILRKNNQTLAWKLYERGRHYNSTLVPDQYRLVETNTRFFAGDQWINLPDTRAMRGLPKPTFNILKRIASLFVASLTGTNLTIHVDALNDARRMYFHDHTPVSDSQEEAVRIANAELSALLEKLKLEYRIRDALFDGAQTGDYAAHFWFDPDAVPYGGAPQSSRGEIRMELVDGINILFGNPDDRNVENQPYILIVGRESVERLREEAFRWRHNSAVFSHGPEFSPDSNTESNSGPENKSDFIPESNSGPENKSDFIPESNADFTPEPEWQWDCEGDEFGKALYVLLYTKSEHVICGPDGQPHTETTVHVTKATQNAVVYENVDTGLSLYPIAWGNWEKQKNQYHGRALLTGMIPNQIFINTMFATAMRHLQLMAFPRTVYNADLISAWTNEVGQAVGIHGLQPGQSVSSVAANLQAAEMSSQIFTLIDKAMSYTRECMGAADVQLGTASPQNTSALMVLQTNAEIPLENVRAGLYEWLEDIGAILLDMMGTYYGRRPYVKAHDSRSGDSKTPNEHFRALNKDSQVPNKDSRIWNDFDFSVFKQLWFRLRVDVGAANSFNEITLSQTLDMLRREGVLTTIQYLERMPERFIPRKSELIDELRAAAELQTQITDQQSKSDDPESNPLTFTPDPESNPLTFMPDPESNPLTLTPDPESGLHSELSDPETDAQTGMSDEQDVPTEPCENQVSPA